MTRVLTRLSIPPRLRDEMMLKTGHQSNTFDVPNTKEGNLFLDYWKGANSEDRDAMMKRAYDENIPIHEARPVDKKEEKEETDGGND